MKKPIMKWTALLLAVIMAVMPVSSSYAAGGVSDIAVEIGDETGNLTMEETVAEEANTAELTEESTSEEGGETTTEETSSADDMEEENDSVTEEETATAEEESSQSGEEEVTEESTSEETESISGNGTEETTEENDTEESDSENNTEESVSENGTGETTEESISGNDTEESVSGNDAEESVSENDAEPVFPGMGDNYVMTAKQRTAKETLGKYLGEIDEMQEGQNYVPGELVYSTDSEEEAQRVAAAYGGELKSYFDGVAVIGLAENVTVSQAVHAAADTKNNLPAAYPNYYRYLHTDDMGSMQASSVMNDPYLSTETNYYQWQHYAVGSMYAWDAGYKGDGIKVAVIDTGVDADHEDISAVYHYNAVTNTPGSESADDNTNGHGTHVAGIIAADGNNGKGGSGIAPGAKIYNIKVFDDKAANGESGSLATIARAINHATAQGVDIINMSLGGPGYSEIEHEAVQNAVNAGIAVFISAGNESARTKAYPAAFEESICIAALGKDSGKSSFTNYGNWVDLCAPGVDIYSTYPEELEDPDYTDTNDIGYEFMSGTSQAAPVTAGVAAVILSADLPELNGKTGAEKVAALRSLMEGNVKKSSSKDVGKGIPYLPQILEIVDAAAKPGKPQISLKAGTYKETGLETTISGTAGCELYYSIDGKTPSLKNGVVVNGIKASGISQTLKLDEIVNEKTGKVTVKAIAVNKYSNTAGAAVSASYTLKPRVESVSITGATSKVPAGKSLTLKAAVTPAYAENKSVVWSIDAAADSGVSITTGGVVKVSRTALTDITYTVTATPKDGKGGEAGTYEVTVEAAKIKSVKFVPTSVKLSMKTESVEYNLADTMEVVTLDGSAATAADFIWSSNKPAVATIDEKGIIRTVGAGTATITALAADGSGVKKTFSVTVTQLAKEITITQPVDKENVESVLLAAGKSVALKANVLPATTKNKAVVWEITPADQGVSISKSGKVSAKADAIEGAYTVKATAKDGSETYDEITVNVYIGAATKVTLNEINGAVLKNATIFRKTTDYGLPTSVNIQVTPTGATGHETDYTVTSSNENLVTVSKNGNIVTATATGNASGTATIKVVMNDGSGKSATCKVTVKNPLSGLSITPQAGRTGDVAKGKKLKLVPVFEEEYGKAARKVKWSVVEGEDFATVNSSGVVTAKKGDYMDLEYLYAATVVIKAEATDGSGISTLYRIRIWECPTGMALITQIPEDPGPFRIRCHIYYTFKYEGEEVYSQWMGGGFCPEVNIEMKKTDAITIKNHSYDGYFDVYIWEPVKDKITVTALDGSGKKTVLNVNIR